MTTSTFKRHYDAIKSDHIEATNLIGLRKAFNHHARLANRWPGNRCNVTAQESDMLWSAIQMHKPRIYGHWHNSGLALLNSKRYARQLASVAAHIPAIDHFRLSGFDWLDRAHCVATYDACDMAGKRLFTFRNVPWQSGGNGPELVR